MVTIEARYNGPPDSGNGGWSAGTVAAFVERPAGAVVTLRVPPPLDTPFSVVREGNTVQVFTPDGTLVADAGPTDVNVSLIAPVDFATAVETSKHFAGFVAHPFPTCFVCGPARAVGDGLRMFPGHVEPGRTATPWLVPDDVSPTMVWAALDCPGGWTVDVAARPYVLGRITVRLDAMPEPADKCVVMGQLLMSEGRKATVATTLYGPAGDPLARSQATWIAIA
jgi:hypothetical protein